MAAQQGQGHSIQGAIEQCLAGCYRDESPVFRLNECLARLRQEGYGERELRNIELSVLKRLVGLMSDEQASADDTVID